MSFILTEEQEELLALVRKFSEKEILPCVKITAFR